MCTLLEERPSRKKLTDWEEHPRSWCLVDSVKEVQRLSLGMDSCPSTAAIIQAMRATPAFPGHGPDDQSIAIDHGHKVRRVLQSIGLLVECKEYVGAER
jgi:hypothetical protein